MFDPSEHFLSVREFLEKNKGIPPGSFEKYLNLFQLVYHAKTYLLICHQNDLLDKARIHFSIVVIGKIEHYKTESSKIIGFTDKQMNVIKVHLGKLEEWKLELTDMNNSNQNKI